MARLFGLIGNRADLGGRVLAHESFALRVGRANALGSEAGPLGWGVGFYQGGEVLMRRRPLDERDTIEVASLAADVRADVLIGHVRAATIGSLRAENTHPFRYRQWLFAQTGTIEAFDTVRARLVASVPEFLRSGIRGETDAEVMFHLFLSFLHDAGRLGDGAVDAGFVGDALRSSLVLVDGMTAEVGAAPAELNVLVSNGDHIVALHRGRRMAYRTLRGKDDAEALMGDDVNLRRKTPELGRMVFNVVASNFEGDVAPPLWRQVEGNTLVTLTRADDPVVSSF